MEIWKDIKGYEGLYQVSNCGRVKSFKRKKEQGEVVGGFLAYGNYPAVQLSIKGQRYKNFSIHRLVAAAFIDNPDQKEQVNHIDGDKTNNHADNLEWVTGSENALHAYEIGLSTPPHQKAVQQFTIGGELIAEYVSTAEAGRVTGLEGRNIRYCGNGKRKTCGGFVWKFKEEETWLIKN